jgi:hypothetical protein|tara:strand:+ start:649 stop:1032 length:384 start_codon:yes stop_codon:yes gene_type:complete
MTKQEIEQIRFSLEVQFREQLIRRPEFPFLQSIGTKDIFQPFKHHTEGTFFGTLHLVWISGKTWKRETWFDTLEEAENYMRKLYDEKSFSSEKLLLVHHAIEIQRQEKINVEREMENLLENGDILWN